LACCTETREDLASEVGAGWVICDANQFIAVDPKTFLAAWEEAGQAVRERSQLSGATVAGGWREDPSGSGLRQNDATGEWDDSCFVHVAPIRPATRSRP
jgi:hypothetical protein